MECENHIPTHVLQLPCLTPNRSVKPRLEHWQRQSRRLGGAGANTALSSPPVWARAVTARQPRAARAAMVKDFIFSIRNFEMSNRVALLF